MALTKVTGGVVSPTSDYTIRNVTGVAATFTGNVNVEGVLTYEDVTNVDSVGVITARTDIHVGENIAHLGDTDTKIVLTDNQLDFQTGGFSRAYLNNWGFYIRSGFGLSFLASSGPSPAIKSGGTNAQDLLLTTGTDNPTRVVIASDGKVGIATITPRAFFDVRPGGHSGNGAITFTTGLGEVGSSNNAIQSINGTGSALQPLGYRATEHIFATQSAEALRITSDGDLRIGNTTQTFLDAARNLVVGGGSGSEGITIYSGASDGGFIAFADGTSDPAYRMGQIIYDHGANEMLFRTNGNTNRLIIDSDGHLGVGDASPDTRLSVTAASGTDVVGKFTSTDAKAWIQFRDNSTTDTGVMIGAEGDDLMLRAGSNERLRITSTGAIKLNDNNIEPTGAGGNVTTAYTDAAWEKIKFDASYNQNPIGPNKIILQYDTGGDGWYAGFGIAANELSVYSGGNTVFYQGFKTAGTINERFRIDANGWQSGHTAYQSVGINTFSSWARTGGAIRAEVGYNAVTLDYMYFGTGTAHPVALRSNNTTALLIDTNQRVLVGGQLATIDTSTYNSKLQVMSDDAEASITIGRFGNNASATALNFSKSRGADVGSHTSGDLHDNDVIGNIFWWGSDGSDYEEVARIGAEADTGDSSAFTGSSTPGALTFHTTAANATTATERLRIHSTGVVQIGDSTASSLGDRLLQIGKTNRSGTYVEIRNSTTGVGGIVFSDGTAADNTGYRGTIEYDHGATNTDEMFFKTSALERLRITNDKVMFSVDAKVDADNTRDLGASGARWKSLHLGTSARIGATGTTASTAGDDLVIEGSSDRGLSIISGNTSSSNIYLGRANDADVCRIAYQHNDNALDFSTNAGGTALRINSSGQLIMTNAATKTFFDFSTTDNSSRGLFSVAGKDSNGNAVTVKIGGFGDTNRGEIYTHSDHALGFATNNAAAQMKLNTNGSLSIGGNARGNRLTVVGPNASQGGANSGTMTDALAMFYGGARATISGSNTRDVAIIHIKGQITDVDANSTGNHATGQLVFTGRRATGAQAIIENETNWIYNTQNAGSTLKFYTAPYSSNGGTGPSLAMTLHNDQHVTLANYMNISSSEKTGSYITSISHSGNGAFDGGLVFQTRCYEEYHFKWTGQYDHTVVLDGPNYLSAWIEYQFVQTNGGNDTMNHVRGKWANNHTTHTWSQDYASGGASALASGVPSFTASDQSGNTSGGSANARLTIYEDYQGSALSMHQTCLIVRIYYSSGNMSISHTGS